jgi:hypothetical protein
VAQECEGQTALAADAAEALVDNVLGLADPVETEVGEFVAFRVPQICSTGLRSGA